MNDKEKRIKLYHGQILELIKSYQGKNLIGKLTRNRQDIRTAYIKKAENLLLKMIDLDESSPHVEDIRKKLFEYLR